MSDITLPVETQLRAYNQRDIDAFISVYAAETRITRLPDTVALVGLDAIRERYAGLFESSPELRAVVNHRTVIGDWVVDHETVTGASIPGIGEAVVAYQVRGDKIINVFLMK